MPIPAHYHETIVTPKASSNVEAYWTFTATKAGQSLVLPDGRCDIILRSNAHDSAPPTLVVTGPATQPYTVEYEVGDSWVGVRLRPDTSVNLWQRKIVHAVDTVIRGQDALAVLPQLAHLHGRFLTVGNLAASIDYSNSPVADQRLSPALNALHASGGRIRIEKLALVVGCTSRQLNRLFRANTGLTTKTYAQLIQFHRSLKLIKTEQLSISDAAFEGGYADQAHLTRAFQRFGGFTPSTVPNELSLPSLSI